MNKPPKHMTFKNNGYVIDKKLLALKSDRILNQVESAIEAMASNINITKEQYLNSVSRWDAPNDEVQRLVDELTPSLKPLAEACFGDKLEYVRASIIRKSHQAKLATHGHQDAGYWGVNSSDMYDVSTWVAIEDTDSSNGALRILPKSHLDGVRQQGDFLSEDFLDPAKTWGDDQTLEMKAGDVAVFDPYLWHASHPCDDSKTRLSFVVRWKSQAAINRPLATATSYPKEKFGMTTSGKFVTKALHKLLPSTKHKPLLTDKIKSVLDKHAEEALLNPPLARRALIRLLILISANEKHHGNDAGCGVWLEVRDSVVNPLIAGHDSLS